MAREYEMLDGSPNQLLQRITIFLVGGHLQLTMAEALEPTKDPRR